MKGLVWFISVVVFGIWSLLSWGAWALVGVTGDAVARHADVVPGSPELVEWISWLGGTGGSVGEWLVVVVWALGSLAIFALAAVIKRLLGHRAAPQLPQ